MDEKLLASIHSKTDQLIETVSRLQLENRQLKEREHWLMKQNDALMQKNDLAKSKVESMIEQLKSMEQENYH